MLALYRVYVKVSLIQGVCKVSIVQGVRES